MYAWLWRHLPGGRRARLAQLVAAAVLLLIVCFVWVFPAISTLSDRQGATVGSAPSSTEGKAP